MVAHPKTSPPNTTLYEQDYYLWVLETVGKIRANNFAAVDWENVVEELESLGRSDKRELRNRLTVVIEHLLKLAYWDAEREYNARGWNNTIVEQRRKIEVLLEDSPSLKPILVDLFSKCYADARKDAIRKTGLSESTFPENSPFTFKQVLDPDYFYEV